MDALVLGGALLACTALTVAGLVSSPPNLSLDVNKQLSSPAAPWCVPGQAPTFSFGFAELAGELGPIMGQAVECEHGAPSSSDTLQQTTTGVALYQWCLNTSTFTRGQDRWSLLPGGIVHWTDGEPPPAVAVVRAPDLRSPCPPG
jgi:hypothetical protein